MNDDGRRGLLDRHGSELLRVALDAVDAGLYSGIRPAIDATSYAEPLRRPGATFITLYANGRLRGCIGSSRAVRPLVEDVARNAWSAAFEDTRFGPLTSAERARLELSLSLLSEPQPLMFSNEADLLQQLRRGEDGLIIECAGRRALFLPQVWDSLPSPPEFLAQLKDKAGLASERESPGLCAWRFTTDSIFSSATPE